MSKARRVITSQATRGAHLAQANELKAPLLQASDFDPFRVGVGSLGEGGLLPLHGIDPHSPHSPAKARNNALAMAAAMNNEDGDVPLVPPGSPLRRGGPGGVAGGEIGDDESEAPLATRHLNQALPMTNKLKTDRELARKTLWLNLNSFFGMAMMIGQLQACWDGEVRFISASRA